MEVILASFGYGQLTPFLLVGGNEILKVSTVFLLQVIKKRSNNTNSIRLPAKARIRFSCIQVLSMTSTTYSI